MRKHGHTPELVHAIANLGQLFLAILVDAQYFDLLYFAMRRRSLSIHDVCVEAGPLHLQLAVAKVLANIEIFGLASAASLASTLLRALRADQEHRFPQVI